MEVGKLVPTEKLLSFLFDFEGEITLRYGKIGQGKTYGATADVLDDLRRGWIVYTTWPIQFDGYDQRTSWLFIIGSLLYPWRNTFLVIPKENLRYIDIFDDTFIDNFEKLKNCKVYLDEGHIGFDSYEMAKASLKKRASVLHTRHFNRSINIISQRPGNVKLDYRSQVNFWYRCEKKLSWPWVVFQKTIIQDVKADHYPDEEHESNSRQVYFASREVFNAYNTHGMRDKDATYRERDMEVYRLNFGAKISAMMIAIWQGVRGGRPRLSGATHTQRLT